MNTQHNQPKRPWYTMKQVWTGAVVGLLITGVIVGCEEDSAPSSPATTPAVTTTASATTATPQEGEETGSGEPTEQAVVPDVVGMNHADALTLLHEASFMVNEEDASPEGRWIIANSNWQVCSQDPGPGATDVIRVTIYSVKNDESC